MFDLALQFLQLSGPPVEMLVIQPTIAKEVELKGIDGQQLKMKLRMRKRDGFQWLRITQTTTI